MRFILTIILTGILAVFLAACGSTQAVENANQGAETANDAKPEDLSGEVPKFDDAATALAEGDKYFDANLNEKAINAYKQATELDPDLAEAHFKLGISYALIEKEQELIPTAIEQPAEEPAETDKKTDKKQEEKPLSVKAFEEAVKAYKKYLKENPKDDLAHFNLGRSYNKLNEDKEARKSLEQAVKLNPDNSLYQLELGTILMKLAQYDEAVRALKKAIALDDGNARAEALLVKAEAGKKRVDFGVEKLKAASANNDVPSQPSKDNKKDKDEDSADEDDSEGKKDGDKKAPKPKSPAKTAANKS